MSVIPQDDNLVMSFAEATRVFNRQQSNIDPFVSGTAGLSQQQLPSSIDRGNSYAHPNDVAGTNGAAPRQGIRLGAPLQQFPDDSSTQRTGLLQKNLSSTPSRPAEIAPGPASVVPAQDEANMMAIDRNPGGNVEVRNPSQGNRILANEPYFNPWFKIRAYMRVYFAEFLGTYILVLWGEGTQAQVVAARKTPTDYLSVAWGWGVGFMLAIFVSAGISGGHVNPAVTISLSIFRGFPWRRVPGYILAQLLGAFAAAATILGIYDGPFSTLPYNGVAAVMTTGPSDLGTPAFSATFFSVVIGAALLMLSIAAFTDLQNNPTTAGLTPLLLGLIMVGIASAFGYQTGFVLNPARDLGPRLLVWASGRASTQFLWRDNQFYGVWVPTAGTIVGAFLGILVYDLLIYTGRDSPVNANFSRKASHHLERWHDADLERAPSSGSMTVVGSDAEKRNSKYTSTHV